MELKYLLCSIEERVALVRLNRPDKGNALSPEVLQEVGDVFLDLARNEDVSVVVLTGSDRIFSAGFDLEIVKPWARRTARSSPRSFIGLTAPSCSARSQ